MIVSLPVDLLIALAMLIFGIALAMIVTHFDEFTIIAFMESLPTGLLCACCTYLYAPGTCTRPENHPGARFARNYNSRNHNCHNSPVSSVF